MNRLAKGTVWGAAGVALLLGGTGTFALWSDSLAAGTEGNTVDAGHLYIDDDALTGTWYDVTGLDVPATFADASAFETYVTETLTAHEIADLDGYGIVPGDTFWYVSSVDVVAHGHNLKASLGVTVGDGAYADTAADAPRVDDSSDDGSALGDDIAFSLVGPGASDGVFEVTNGGMTPQTFPFALQLSYDPAADDNAAQGDTISLSDVSVSLNQHL